jgi:hypothetical protein
MLQSRFLILNSLRLIPVASYQRSSARWIEPSDNRSRATPLRLRQRPRPSQSRYLANTGAGGESFGFGNLTENLEVHGQIVIGRPRTVNNREGNWQPWVSAGSRLSHPQPFDFAIQAMSTFKCFPCRKGLMCGADQPL